jgi:hypothetical protein
MALAIYAIRNSAGMIRAVKQYCPQLRMECSQQVGRNVRRRVREVAMSYLTRAAISSGPGRFGKQDAKVGYPLQRECTTRSPGQGATAMRIPGQSLQGGRTGNEPRAHAS